MLRAITAVLVCAGLAAPAAAQSQNPLPKEGPIELTLSYQVTFQNIVLDKEFTQSAYESYTTTLAAKEGGFGDRMTGRCLGSTRLVKGKIDAEIGGCRYIDRNGDVFFTSYSYTATDTPGTAIGKHVLVGGTGKFTGVTGSWETKRQPLPAPGEGRGAGTGYIKGTYKLP
jgi:hypothetical protein